MIEQEAPADVLGDLRRALKRSYGASRLANASYEELIAMVEETSMRDRQGRRLRGDIQITLNKIEASL